MGTLPMNGWWTEYDGYVFNDTNRNGVKDPGENGVPNFTPDPAQAGELADGPRPDHGHDRRQRATTASRAPTRWASGP